MKKIPRQQIKKETANIPVEVPKKDFDKILKSILFVPKELKKKPAKKKSK
jgi:hypothetical protein